MILLLPLLLLKVLRPLLLLLPLLPPLWMKTPELLPPLSL